MQQAILFAALPQYYITQVPDILF